MFVGGLMSNSGRHSTEMNHYQRNIIVRRFNMANFEYVPKSYYRSVTCQRAMERNIHGEKLWDPEHHAALTNPSSRYSSEGGQDWAGRGRGVCRVLSALCAEITTGSPTNQNGDAIYLVCDYRWFLLLLFKVLATWSTKPGLIEEGGFCPAVGDSGLITIIFVSRNVHFYVDRLHTVNYQRN